MIIKDELQLTEAVLAETEPGRRPAVPEIVQASSATCMISPRGPANRGGVRRQLGIVAGSASSPRPAITRSG